VFAGDRRVWRWAALAALPLVGLIVFYCLRPNNYYTGTDNVEAYTYVVQTPTGQPVCVPGLQIPAGTGRIRLQVISITRERPTLRMTLSLEGGRRRIESRLGPVQVGASRISGAVFPIPVLSTRPAEHPASVCLTAADVVNWGGTPLPTAPSPAPPTLAGHALAARIAVWYLPPAGARSSYIAQAGTILHRASLFRPGLVGPWLYWVILLGVLPALAVASVRCLALASPTGRQGVDHRRLAAWLFAIAALNFACWALITPPFQSPDEVDHFAYTQSLVERGVSPSRSTDSPLPRWSGAESLLLHDMSFFTDHQAGGTRPPWSARQQAQYRAQVAALHPSSADGGGYETSAAHGAIYYGALAPAYALASSSPLDQLTLMRLASALLGALTVLFAFLLARELAPGRLWFAVLAALLVAYEPMYGFISGAVNNDVGVNAAAAALALLLIRLLRRGITIPWGALTGVVLVALPMVKGTGLSLYPVAGLVLLATLWRHHSRTDLYGIVALALGGLLAAELSAHTLGSLQPRSSSAGSAAISSNASAVNDALHHIPEYLSYLWQAVLPRLPFMTHHFPPPEHAGFVVFHDPGFVIFVERGWGVFGWYDVFFPHWVYVVIFLAIFLAFPLGAWAARREWSWVRRHWLEVLALIAIPVAVVMGFEAAYYTPLPRPAIAEFGRYAFPAIAPLAVLVVGALSAFGRERMLAVGVGLLIAMVALSYSAQLVTLTGFYA
jgi:Predicted membrane protein (DUF2142)